LLLPIQVPEEPNFLPIFVNLNSLRSFTDNRVEAADSVGSLLGFKTKAIRLAVLAVSPTNLEFKLLKKKNFAQTISPACFVAGLYKWRPFCQP